MKFEILFTVKGPNGTALVPPKTNPVEASSLDALLTQLSGNLPGSKQLGFETIGIAIKPCIEDE